MTGNQETGGKEEQGQARIQAGGTHQDSGQEASSRLETIKDALGIVQSLVVIFGFLVGGAWFLLRGEAMPRANVSQVICHRQLNDKWTWVHVAVSCENVGNRPLALESGTIRIQKILPLDPIIIKFFDDGLSPISPTELKVAWPELDSHETGLAVRIEPGEIHRSTFDFIIPTSIKTVRIYSAFSNPEQPGICWNESTIYDLKEQGGRQ